jgi:hypothetical protein
VGLPEIQAMAVLRLAGLDHRRLLYSTDNAEIAVEQAVGQAALEMLREHERVERVNLATEIGNRVGQHVSRAVNAIARAMR